jgi:hypothetical protein
MIELTNLSSSVQPEDDLPPPYEESAAPPPYSEHMNPSSNTYRDLREDGGARGGQSSPADEDADSRTGTIPRRRGLVAAAVQQLQPRLQFRV